ncbi:hypothetical protein RKD26_001261 [Streptomyces calvus]
MHREPVDGAHRPARPLHPQQRGERVDGVGEVVAVRLRVAVEGGAGAVDAGPGQRAVAEDQFGRREVVVGAPGRLEQAVRHGLEGLAVEAERRRVVQQVVRVAAGTGVRVGGRDQHVPHGVEIAVRLGEPPQHRPVHALEDHRRVGDDQHHPPPARLLDHDERAGPQPGVQPGRLLVEPAVPHHPHLGHLTGGVGETPADQVAGVTGSVTSGGGGGGGGAVRGGQLRAGQAEAGEGARAQDGTPVVKGTFRGHLLLLRLDRPAAAHARVPVGHHRPPGPDGS